MSHGTEQGCVLAQTLSSVVLKVVLLILLQETNNGVYVRHRTAEKLFHLIHPKAVTKTQTDLVREL